MAKRDKKKQFSKAKARLKKIGIFAGVAFLLLSFIAGLSENFLRPKVDIKGFDKELSEVPAQTRRAIRRELAELVRLNSGRKNYDSDFVLRDSSVLTHEKDGKGYASLYIDSEKMQLSIFMQLSWNHGGASDGEAYTVRSECADREHWKFENNFCVAPYYDKVTGEPSDNLLILDSYGYDGAELYRKAIVSYFQAIEPKVDTIFLLRDSIKNEAALDAELLINNKRRYELKIDKSDRMVILKNGTELWSPKMELFERNGRHYSMISGFLPVELKTKNGTDFALRWGGKNRIKIYPDYYAEGDTDESLQARAVAWLEDNGFEPSDFEITFMSD